MASFVDENSHILSNEAPSSSLVLSLDKEKIVSSNDNTIVRSIFDTPTNDNNKVNNNDISISSDDITPIINDNNKDNKDIKDNADDNDDVEREEENEQEETLEDKQRRELEESERLAWEIMQQEEQQYYQQQVEYMRQNSETISAEDLAAIQQIVNEPTVRFQQNGDEEGDESDEEGEEGEEEENWDYDQLIALGQAIGDVKTERWRLRSKNVIDGLTVIDYDEILKNSSSNIVTVNNDKCEGNDQSLGDQSFKKIRIDHSCTVCMDNFEKTDKLNLLPCSHYFHMTCLQGWLSDHNSCPVCKRKVTSSP